MYDLFIEWVARPIYRFIIRPIMGIKKTMITTLKYMGKFLWYLMFATTGNIIVLSIVLTCIKYHAEITPHFPDPGENAWMFG